MSTAEETLRKAAEKLRTLAGDAQPGPWTQIPERHVFDHYRTIVQEEDRMVPIAGTSLEGDAEYIATMHPGIGLALADWLDLAAGTAEFAEQWNLPNTNRHPLAVARAVLGEAS